VLLPVVGVPLMSGPIRFFPTAWYHPSTQFRRVAVPGPFRTVRPSGMVGDCEFGVNSVTTRRDIYVRGSM
jgi:hypothetical protein